MQLVQINLTDQQAALLRAAADTTIRADAEGQLVSLEDEEREALQQLAVFMDAVAENPNHFPVREDMARTIKTRTRQLKGPAQPARKKNKSKARQAARHAFQKVQRKNRREIVAEFNRLREAAEAERAAMEAKAEQRRAEIENEPRFDVTDLLGNVIMAGVPRSMIRAEEVAYEPTPLDAVTAPQVVLSGNIEKALQRESS